MATHYEKTADNTVVRMGARGNYEAEVVHKIVNAAPILHVSFCPDPYEPVPVILPMLGVVARYEAAGANNKDDEAADADADAHYCYLHGYTSSRFFKQATKVTDDDGDDPTETLSGLPVCIAATLVDGLVLSLTPNSHSFNYRSAVLHAGARVVRDEAERLWAMETITNAVVPSRWSQTRTPPNKTELTSTKILKARIITASAKVRNWEPSDEQYDRARDDVVDSTWTGVVPCSTQFGEPVPSSYNRVKQVPDNIAAFVKKRNEDGRVYASSVASNPPPSKK
ncbi:hypothetical protein V8E36_005883 [Tilletia maclaganii]